MTETPSSAAGTPPVRGAGPDLLSEILRAVRLNGAVFLSACFTTPFGVVDPKVYDQRTPMGRLRHVSILHLVVEGACALETATGERRMHESVLHSHRRPEPGCWRNHFCAAIDLRRHGTRSKTPERA